MDREDVQTAKTTDLQGFANAVVEQAPPRAQQAAVLGSTIAAPVVAPIAKTMDHQGTNNAAAAVALAVVDQQAPRATGIVVVEHAGENGKDLAQIQAASSLGDLPSACLIMPLLVLSAIHQVRPSSLLRLREIPFGRMVVLVANVFCLLHLLVER